MQTIKHGKAIKEARVGNFNTALRSKVLKFLKDAGREDIEIQKLSNVAVNWTVDAGKTELDFEFTCDSDSYEISVKDGKGEKVEAWAPQESIAELTDDLNDTLSFIDEFKNSLNTKVSPAKAESVEESEEDDDEADEDAEMNESVITDKKGLKESEGTYLRTFFKFDDMLDENGELKQVDEITDWLQELVDCNYLDNMWGVWFEDYDDTAAAAGIAVKTMPEILAEDPEAQFGYSYGGPDTRLCLDNAVDYVQDDGCDDWEHFGIKSPYDDDYYDEDYDDEADEDEELNESEDDGEESGKIVADFLDEIREEAFTEILEEIHEKLDEAGYDYLDEDTLYSKIDDYLDSWEDDPDADAENAEEAKNIIVGAWDSYIDIDAD